MNSNERARTQFLKLFHGAAHNVSIAADMDAHVVSRGIDPIDIVMGNKLDFDAVSYGQTAISDW